MNELTQIMNNHKEKKFKYDGRLHTYTGKMFNPFNPDLESICIEDIAHALSNTCRFGGHSKEYYSVAEHSVLVSMLCDESNAFEGLMHDAAEAYLGDIPTPLKERLPGFMELEDSVLKFIFNKYNLSYPLSNNVKKMDEKALTLEFESIRGITNILQLQSPKEAEEAFLKRFHYLNNKRIK